MVIIFAGEIKISLIQIIDFCVNTTNFPNLMVERQVQTPVFRGKSNRDARKLIYFFLQFFSSRYEIYIFMNIFTTQLGMNINHFMIRATTSLVFLHYLDMLNILNPVEGIVFIIFLSYSIALFYIKIIFKRFHDQLRHFSA